MADFDDGKEDGALRTIGEVANALGIKAHVLRYWEQQFPMLKPLKRSGGRRYYRADDVTLVQNIDRLVNAEGYTLKGAKAVLKGAASARPQNSAEPARTIDTSESTALSRPEIVSGLKSIRDDLRQALAV